MEILIDQWTPFFDELSTKLNSEGRRKLLFQLIGDVYDVTVLNLGESGIARPEEWAPLTERYAREKHEGDRTPTLILKGDLKSLFVVDFNSEYATLTNATDYADLHQFGNPYSNLPARPFYPVDETGENFTPYMQIRLNGIVESYFQLSAP